MAMNRGLRVNLVIYWSRSRVEVMFYSQLVLELDHTAEKYSLTIHATYSVPSQRLPLELYFLSHYSLFFISLTQWAIPEPACHVVDCRLNLVPSGQCFLKSSNLNFSLHLSNLPLFDLLNQLGTPSSTGTCDAPSFFAKCRRIRAPSLRSQIVIYKIPDGASAHLTSE